MRRLLEVVLLVSCAFLAFAAGPPIPQTVATATTRDLFEILLRGPEGPSFATVTFFSNTSVVLRECSTTDHARKCPLSVFRWENGVLERAAYVPDVEPRSSRLSDDGGRKLLDFNQREVPRRKRILETIRAVTSLGMIGPEDVNREVVQVFDTATGKSCFELRRSFPMTYGRPRSAAISPSGEFLVIAAENKLTVYRLPTVCDGATIGRSGGK